MRVRSKYCKSFVSDFLNEEKRKELLKKAELIRSLKNSLSEQICDNPLLVKEFSKNDFIKEYNCQVEGLVGREIQPALADVFVKYENKMNQFKTESRFFVQKEFKIEYFKKKTKKNKKGEVKQYHLTKNFTSLSKTISFLARYYNEGFVEYIMNELDSPNTQKTEGQLNLYRDVLKYIYKFGHRLFNLVALRREIITKRVFGNPILFKELTYSSVNNTKTICKNKNEKSEITHFVQLSGFKKTGEEMFIPFKYAKKYHGDLEVFNKNQPTYTVVFVKNKVKINIAIDGERDYRSGATKVLGADINLKHNLFYLSNGDIIEHDVSLIKNFVKTALRFDKKRDFLYKKEDLTELEQKQKEKLLKRVSLWHRKMKAYFNFKAAELIKIAKEEGYNHISMEDLNLSDKSFIKIPELYNVKMSRLVKMIHLSNFKNIMELQCSNKDMQLTIVLIYLKPFTVCIFFGCFNS